jgi:hypothetical protein
VFNLVANKEMASAVPPYIKSVQGELTPGCWQPQSLQEWTSVQETVITLNAWSAQQDEERGLRRMIAIWVFVLISLQIIGVFGVVLYDASNSKLNPEIIKFLIPSVLAEVFGMGLVVVKYLFRPTDSNLPARIGPK